MKDCVNCGFCCRKAPCSAAVRLYGNVTKCPALEYAYGRYFCSLMKLPGKLGPAYREEIGAGTGCCCGLNSDRDNIPPPEPPAPEVYHVSKDLEIFLTALAKQFISSDAIYLACLEAEQVLDSPNFRKEVGRIFRGQRPKYQDEFMGD